MRIPSRISFQWDIGNATKNYTKHKVTKEEAESIFGSKPRILFPDKKHSTKKEKRYAILGKSQTDRLLSVIFTIRHNQVRIISARPQSQKERKIYENF